MPLSELEALVPWGYVAGLKLVALCLVLACCVALTNYQRWRK
jgi:hypothetical protein